MLNKITTEKDIEIVSGGHGWEFESHTQDPEEALEYINKVINILIEAKLFSRYIETPSKAITFNLREESVAKFVRENLIRTGDGFGIFVGGDTTVYLPVDSYPGPKRSVDLDHIVYIMASYTPSMEIIGVFTTSSIWMPFNYKGCPHIDVYTLNLNRLSSVLAKIEALGLKFDNDSYCRNKRCIDSGYLLENYAMDYDCFGNRESDYIEGNDGIYGVGRTD